MLPLVGPLESVFLDVSFCEGTAGTSLILARSSIFGLILESAIESSNMAW